MFHTGCPLVHLKTKQSNIMKQDLTFRFLGSLFMVYLFLPDFGLLIPKIFIMNFVFSLEIF